jgi:hypothetical protein
VSVAERIESATPLRVAAVNEPLRYEPTPFVWYDPASIKQREWIYGYELQRKTVSAIIGPGAAGKSKYKAARAVALTSGKPILGTAVHGGPKNVWIWNHEDHLEELHRDIFAVMQHWRLTPDEVGLGSRLFIDSAMDGEAVKIGRMDALHGAQVNIDVIEALTEALTRKKIDYFDLDPFVSIHGVDENSNDAIDKVAKALARMATAANCSIGIAHHIAKAAADKVNVHAARGAVALTDACRSVLALNRMSEDEAKSFGLIHERRHYFKLLDDKNNRAPPADDCNWFKFENIELPNGDRQGIVVSWTPPAIMDGVKAGHLAEVQRRVAHHSKDPRGVRAYEVKNDKDRWIGRIIGNVIGLDIEKPEDKHRVKRILKEWLASGALVEVRRMDANSDPRPFIEVGNLLEPGTYTQITPHDELQRRNQPQSGR